MGLVRTDERFVVYDDALPPAAFASVWAWLQREPLAPPFVARGLQEVIWRLGDSYPVRTGAYYHSRRSLPAAAPGGFPGALAAAAAAFEEIGGRHPELLGTKGKDWRDVSLTGYVYPRGSRLSWHTDHDSYTAAFVYYVHPRWSASWGGELFIADADGEVSETPTHLDHTAEDDWLMKHGFGNFIMAKPNRLVLIKLGVPHMMARVDPDAGDHVRASILGFFLREYGPPPLPASAWPGAGLHAVLTERGEM
jgi:hypothetical protein